MILRLAVLLARSSRPEHRWRRVAVPLAAAVATMLTLFGVCFMAAIGHQEDRLRARTAYIAEYPAPTDLLVSVGSIWVGDQQVSVNWIAPVGDAPPRLPPGIAQMPAAGTAVVSPALARAIRQDPLLAARFPSYTELASSGVMDQNELLAWIRPVDPSVISGRVAGFGDPSLGTPVDDFAIETLPNEREALVGVLGFIILPAGLLLFLGISAASTLRSQRLSTLRLLGVGRGWVTLLVVVETLALAGPAILVIIVLWSVADGWIKTIPIVDKRLVDGDLNLSYPLLGILLLGLIVSTVVMILLRDAVSLVRRGRAVRIPRVATVQTVAPAILVIPIAVTVVAATNRNLKMRSSSVCWQRSRSFRLSCPVRSNR